MESELKADSWLLVLDGDIAVLNPNTLIEQYIDPDYEITLFDRFFNFEVGANSYLVKNTERGREFVQRFADYEIKLPKSFHGTDNGALHVSFLSGSRNPYLVEYLVPPSDRRLNSVCLKVWRDSKNYRNLYEMEVCTRLIFGDRTHFAEHKLRILPKGMAWVRDLWLLKSRWADDDFMVHAVKEKQLDKKRPPKKDVRDNLIYQWGPSRGNSRIFPVLQKLDVAKCEVGEEQWQFDSRLKITNEKKAQLLNHMENAILKKRLDIIGKLSRKL
ncbi:hypothetical protein PENTCL1PPCAC_15028 [Pristionchus entomophagus]|uniref:Glycosyltransferase family 92 protein n=1 Tax=Pristionchus entomophagus TaxID=358040 RepID=A0AAV5TCE7_9BILA|nr:hypothetical protein PENTCL1PPCAC_15028 [Pristionchus entomophagus]